MTMIKLYGPRLSPPFRAVKLMLEITGIPHEEIFVDFRNESQKSDWFTAINPVQRCPVIDDDGFILSESGAILEYLATKASVADHWLPCDPKSRSRVSEYLYWHQSYGLRHNGILNLVATGPYVSGNPVNEDVLKERCEALIKTLDVIESYYLNESRYIAGNELTIADLMVAVRLAELEALGFPYDVTRPKLKTYWQVVKTALQPHFDTVHNGFYKFTSDYKRTFE